MARTHPFVDYAADAFPSYASHCRDVALRNSLTNYDPATADVLAESIRQRQQHMGGAAPKGKKTCSRHCVVYVSQATGQYYR